MDNSILIIDATPQDSIGFRGVQKISWLATYPNEELGITSQDIEKRFDDSTKEARKSIEERKRAINTDPSSHTWVAKFHGKIVGFCATTKGKENHIQAIYILPEFQGKGIGKRFMQVGLTWLGDKEDVYVNTASYNQKAIDFYKSFGFVDTGESVQPSVIFKSGVTIPEIKMVKKQTVHI